MNLPPIYWMNLERASERRARMTKRLEERQLQHVRVEAVDATLPGLAQIVKWSNKRAGPPLRCDRTIEPIEAAVVAAHLRAIKRAYEDGVERALIFEDDVTFDLLDRWPEGWATVSAALPERFGLLQLCVASSIDELAELFSRDALLQPIRDGFFASAAAYLIERSAMRTLLDAYDRGDHFDISARSAPAEHVLFAGPLMSARDFSGPFVSRIPLFLYEGDDSFISDDHNDYLRPSRVFLLQHYDALVSKRFSRTFAPLEAMPDWPPLPSPPLLPRPWRVPSAPERQARQRSWLMSPTGLGAFIGGSRRPVQQSQLLTPSPSADPRELIWLPAGQVEAFTRERLSRQEHPFVLVTQSRQPLPAAPECRERILSHRLCRGWFATHSYDDPDPRLTPMPLGVDFALVGEQYPDGAGDSAAIARRGERLQRFWSELGAWLPSRESRIPVALFEKGAGAFRQTCVSHLIELSNPSARWARASRCALFVAAPDGRDSTAIWTSLLFGLVVAAPRWRRREGLEALPLLWLDRPEEITEDFIAAAMQHRRDARLADVQRYLSFGYWHEQMRARLM